MINALRRSPRALAAWAIGAGVALLLVTVGVVLGARATPSVGGDAAAKLASPSASAPSVASRGPTVPVQPGGLPSVTPVVPPTGIRIPAIAVTASVLPAGIDPVTGDLAVPPSIDRVGWYRYGPGLEAQSGSVVIAGHVDSAEQGKGAFYRLRELKPGDAIDVTGATGAVRTYRVVAREEWTKSKIPLAEYFGRDGAPRLTLITCGGPFDAASHSYRDNIVVTATPVP